MINVWIDEMTPCLKDAKTGEIIPTEVIRIVRKSFLSKYLIDQANFHENRQAYNFELSFFLFEIIFYL